MTGFFPVIELVDRYVIAKLKLVKTQANQAEFDFYSQQLSAFDLSKIDDKLNELYEIHNSIWQLEADLKSGQEQNLELAEIGRRAILIRNCNNKRIAIKNQLADILGCSVKEIKKDHLSE